MKPFLFVLLIAFASCATDEVVAPAECTLMSAEVLDANVRLHLIPEVDTITFTYTNQDGIGIRGYWIDGQIEWECIGFTRYATDYEVTIFTKTDTCVILIPSLYQ
jgi:hypothetical protein